MRWLILNTDYHRFLTQHYAHPPALRDATWNEQQAALRATAFGVSPFYVDGLNRIGHEAQLVSLNNRYLQRAWARERGLWFDDLEQDPLAAGDAVSTRAGQGGLATRRQTRPATFLRPVRESSDAERRAWYEILCAQVEEFSPDIIVNQCPEWTTPELLRALRGRGCRIIGQHPATPLTEVDGWLQHDLVVSSFPPTVAMLRTMGVPAVLHRLGFEPDVLHDLPSTTPVDVAFVGNFYGIHSSRTAWLETVCETVPSVAVWSDRVDHLSPESPIRRAYRGPLWGRAMYAALAAARITLNHHGDIGPYANNLRLYEATGCGSLLITDDKRNLHEIFNVGEEILAYRDAQECVGLIRRYLDDEPARARIAAAGRRRTHTTHTWTQRMEELDAIIRAHF